MNLCSLILELWLPTPLFCLCPNPLGNAFCSICTSGFVSGGSKINILSSTAFKMFLILPLDAFVLPNELNTLLLLDSFCARCCDSEYVKGLILTATVIDDSFELGGVGVVVDIFLVVVV
ncbi:unnamed protein product [Ambrosiozyma monospora]|uniref:Unnamed protein product n=1 Tax=Ambrosiozyma monospora TaxID=43982 RepID=A0ACB5T9J1_AMBMO|nr:unnamed protein product [Ambrosiozyma monospora]